MGGCLCPQEAPCTQKSDPSMGCGASTQGGTQDVKPEGTQSTTPPSSAVGTELEPAAPSTLPRSIAGETASSPSKKVCDVPNILRIGQPQDQEKAKDAVSFKDAARNCNLPCARTAVGSFPGLIFL
eukprot:TRINITY_DN32680_c0_g1_i2.p3 TRINITY_DN32680_c0_g1~~TRINITY_DN32680_c0_g1_i2.p3  ORF type:complete len:126 (+),score=2.03 TRINITY_DN32680_c0_g1_i2:43-420(+)